MRLARVSGGVCAVLNETREIDDCTSNIHFSNRDFSCRGYERSPHRLHWA